MSGRRRGGSVRAPDRADRVFCAQTIERPDETCAGRPLALVAEAKANEKAFKAKVRTALRSSYSSYYRQMLPPLLRTLGFKCGNTAYRPVMGALADGSAGGPKRPTCAALEELGRATLRGGWCAGESRHRFGVSQAGRLLWGRRPLGC